MMHPEVCSINSAAILANLTYYVFAMNGFWPQLLYRLPAPPLKSLRNTVMIDLSQISYL